MSPNQTLRVVLIRPGLTDFDEQGRIKGSLDLPLCPKGAEQIAAAAAELAGLKIDAVYCSPCQAAKESAAVVAKARKLKVKEVESLLNVNLGLWHGKLIEDVRTRQPKIYRQWQEHPETCCPPEGEPVGKARERIEEGLTKLLRKHKSGTIALVLPEPLASIVRAHLTQAALGDLWKAQAACGHWELLEIQPLAKSEARKPSLVWRGVPAE